jgi:peptidoglycan-associated lipoprotein
MVAAGEAATLKWSTTNATAVTISGLGTVALEGKQEVRPAKSTTYELVANGPGGSATGSATVNVTVEPPPLFALPAVISKSFQDRVETELADIYFSYDESGIREDARAALEKDAEALRAIFAEFPAAVVVLEGHCDERGSAEYNLALGDNRAASARAYLEALGVPADHLKTISYGKERPQCTESMESCWQINRRVHFSAAGPDTAAN